MRGAVPRISTNDWETKKDVFIAMKALDEVARFLGYKEVVMEDETYDELTIYTIPPEEPYNTACADNPSSVRKRLVRRIK